MTETIKDWIDRLVIERVTGPQLKTLVVAIREVYSKHKSE